MSSAAEITYVAPGVAIWQLYDPKVKSDLFSTALDTPAGRYLIDPVQLKAGPRRSLGSERKIAGIVVTNENHARSAGTFSERFSVPIYAHSVLRKVGAFPQSTELHDGQQIAPGLTVVEIAGAPAGEVALHYKPNGGTLVVGDSLINFEPYGFALLPTKYCRDFELMCRTLPRLLDYNFERILFAHGDPLLSGARAKLEQLLAPR